MLDFSQQAYLDSYSILRIRHQDEQNLIKEFRDVLLPPAFKRTQEQEIKREKFLGKKTKNNPDYVQSITKEEADWESGVAKEWIGYRVQHIRQSEAKKVINLK